MSTGRSDTDWFDRSTLESHPTDAGAPSTRAASPSPGQDGLAHLELCAWSETYLGDRLIILRGRINGQDATVLVDGGSTGNFLSQRFVERHQLPTVPTTQPLEIRLADGSPITSTVKSGLLQCKIKSYTDALAGLPIVPLDKYDVVLGKPWLARLNPQVNWRTNVLTFTHRRQRHLLVPTPGDSPGELLPEGINLIESSHDLRRATKDKETELWLAVVRPADPQDTEHAPVPAPGDHNTIQVPGLASLLEEFADVFPADLPAGLPPKRDIEHKIELLPGSAPVHRPAYRMSVAEQDELKRQLQALTERGEWASFAPRLPRSARPCCSSRRRTRAGAWCWTTAC